MSRAEMTISSDTLAWPIRIVAALVLLVLAGGVVIVRDMMIQPPAPQEQPAVAVERSFAAPALQAQAAVVYDIRADAILFSKHGEAQLPLASLTKLMTVYVVGKSFNPSALVTVDAADIAIEGDSGLVAGDRFQMRDLLRFTLTTSSNDGAHALAGAAAARFGGSFVDQMNTAADELGLTQTFFINETGLDQSVAVSGGYGSAQDVARLLGVLMDELPTELRATADPESHLRTADRDVIGENTNIVANHIPNLLASKTGFTDLAGGNLGIVFDAGIDRPIAIVVLGSEFEARFSDTLALMNATLSYFEPPRL